MGSPTALIVGGGIAGISAAWWLDKAGWTSTIIERSPMIREGGYIVSLSGPGLQTLKRMGLVKKIEEISYKFKENVVHDNNGRELLRLRYEDVHGGAESMAVCRGDLARVLREALPESASIRFDQTVTEFVEKGEKVEVVLHGGEKMQADLLIGADGIRSGVRDQTWKDVHCLEHLGYSFAAYDVEDKKELQSDCVSFNSPGHLDVLYSLRNDREAALNIWRNEKARLDHRQSYTMLRDRTTGVSKLVTNAIDRAEKASCTAIVDSLIMVILPSWSRGRVMLLGDAAHCLTLMSGQGACMALASAEVLGQELQTTKDVPQALLNHERKLRPVIERLQQRTRKMAQMYIPKSTLGYYLRNLFLRFMPYSWVVSWHVSSARAEMDLTTQR